MISQIASVLVGAVVGAITGALAILYSLLKVPGTVYEATEKSVLKTFFLTLPALLAITIGMFFAALPILISNMLNGAKTGANQGFVAACLYAIMHFKIWNSTSLQDYMKEHRESSKSKGKSDSHASDSLFWGIIKRHLFAPMSIGEKISAPSISSEARSESDKDDGRKRKKSSSSSGRDMLPKFRKGKKRAEDDEKDEKDGKQDSKDYLTQLARLGSDIQNDIRRLYKEIDHALQKREAKTGEYKDEYNSVRATKCPLSNRPITQLAKPVTITFKNNTSVVYEYDELTSSLSENPGEQPFFQGGTGQIKQMFLGYPFEMLRVMQSMHNEKIKPLSRSSDPSSSSTRLSSSPSSPPSS